MQNKSMWKLCLAVGFAPILAGSISLAAVPEDKGFSPGDVQGQGGGADAPAIRPNELNGVSTGWYTEAGKTNTHAQDPEGLVTNAASHTGTQALFGNPDQTFGTVVHIASPWLNTPAGEAGTKDKGNNGVARASDTFHSDFWFRSVSTSTPTDTTHVTISPDDGFGARLGGYFQMWDKDAGDGGTYSALWEYSDTLGNDADTAPVTLTRGAWYHVTLDIQFNDGNAVSDPTFANIATGADTVAVTIADASNATVAAFTGLGTNDYAPYGQLSAVNSMVVRFKSDYPGGGSGFYFDDWTVSTGASNNAYFTSFEAEAVPEPASIGLLVGAAAMLVGRRSRRSIA